MYSELFHILIYEKSFPVLEETNPIYFNYEPTNAPI